MTARQVNDSKIDEAILACSAKNWLKVAMVVGRAAQRLEPDLPGIGDNLPAVAARIAVLVHDGRLVDQGNIENWRHSEIRLP